MPHKVQSNFRRHQLLLTLMPRHTLANIQPQTPMMSIGYLQSLGRSENPFLLHSLLALALDPVNFPPFKKPRKTTNPKMIWTRYTSCNGTERVTQLEPALCSAFSTTARKLSFPWDLFFFLFLNYYFHS